MRVRRGICCRGTVIPAVRDTAAVVDAFRKESLLLNAGEALELSHDSSVISLRLTPRGCDAKSLFCPHHPQLAGGNSAKYANNKLQLTV